jgi:phospholipid/cholesterol/gamma-HCH transport system substrate-binding protein
VLVALAGVAIAAAAILSGGSKAYTMYAQFRDTGGLRQGFKVRIDGAPVGQVASLRLDSRDHVVAELSIDKSATPVGSNAHATVRAADLLGEKYVDLQPGDRQQPARSGTVIPTSRTGLAVELDDVLNAIDLPTRTALRVFINEQGGAFAGRGGDLASLLAVLPRSLDQTGQLLNQFSHDNQALGRLVEQSNRVIASVAGQRKPLGRLVGSAAGTLATLAAHSGSLGATVARAPATLEATRRALAALEGAAIPLGPAAQGLATTAPQLTATLNALPAFTAAARPTLDIVRRVSPTLDTLGRNGTPIVQHLQSLTGELVPFSRAFDPVTQTLDTGVADALGVLEGWARATQARDGASHVFRFGLTVSPDTFSSLAPLFTSTTHKASEHARTPATTLVAAKNSGSGSAGSAGPSATGRSGAATLPTPSGLLAQLGLATPSSGPSLQHSLQGLLSYLLK